MTAAKGEVGKHLLAALLYASCATVGGIAVGMLLPEQAHACQSWERETAKREEKELVAIKQFLDSLSKAQIARMCRPVRASSDGVTGHGLQTNQDLKPAQYQVYAQLARTLSGYASDFIAAHPTPAKIVSVPAQVYVRVGASVSVGAKQEERGTMWVAVYDYGTGEAISTAGLPSATLGVSFSQVARLSSAQSQKRVAQFEKYAKRLLRTSYPQDLPVPETAFLRRAQVPFAKLTPRQQAWVKRAVLKDRGDMANFPWERSVVTFDRTLEFRGAAFNYWQPPKELAGNGWGHQVL